MSFEFMAVVRNEGSNSSIYRLTLDDELRDELSRSFAVSAGKWQEASMQKAAFNEGYSLADKEIFEIRNYALPPDILNAVRFPQEYGIFDANAKGISDLKAIFSVDAQGGRITAVFKTIGNAKKHQPSKNLMLVCGEKTYVKQSSPGIILDSRITAVYADGTLLFRSPSSVKQVLSLKAYMKEANDLEIVGLLESRFETDPEKILAVADTWMRKRFAELKDSKLLEQRNAVDIYETARSFSADIPIELSKDRTRLVLPEDKRNIRMILKFLNEEYYKGELTGKVYQTPSKRPLQPAENSFGGKPRKAAVSFAR